MWVVKIHSFFPNVIKLGQKLLAYTQLYKNFGGATRVIIIELPKVGGAIAPLAPPVPPPLKNILVQKVSCILWINFVPSK